jgi:hypothetical protein
MAATLVGRPVWGMREVRGRVGPEATTLPLARNFFHNRGCAPRCVHRLMREIDPPGPPAGGCETEQNNAFMHRRRAELLWNVTLLASLANEQLAQSATLIRYVWRRESILVYGNVSAPF